MPVNAQCDNGVEHHAKTEQKKLYLEGALQAREHSASRRADLAR